VTDRELKFISTIDKELIQKVVGQMLWYYGVDLENSKVSDVYQESVEKVWYPPVQINALVAYDNPTSKSTGMGVDSSYTLEVYFHQDELTDRNVSPKEGDFVEYGGIFYELASVTRPQPIAGQIDHQEMVKCVGVPSRQAQFQNLSDSKTNVERTHPIPPNIFVDK
jgi:hypothetical protein